MNARILLAEDNQNLAQLLAAFLKSAGYEPTIAATGRDALRLLAGGGFDLLVLDLNLPETSGVELLQKLRKSPRMADFPVIIITGVYKGDKYAQAALKLGVRLYLEKPFGKEAFAAAVRESLAPAGTKPQPELYRLLQEIFRKRLSGRLTINDSSPVIFVKGEPVAFNAAGRSDFPALLLAGALISSEDVNQFIASGEGQLFFVASGMLTLDDLQNSAYHFLRKLLLENLSLKTGIRFSETLADFEPPLLHLSMPRFFYDALRTYPELFQVEEFAAGNASRYPARTGRFFRLANLMTMVEQDIQLLEKINGQRNVGELLQGSGDRDAAACFLHFLLSMGMIVLRSEAGPEESPDFFQKLLFNRPLEEDRAIEEVAIDFDDIVEEVADSVVMAMGESNMAAPLSQQEIGFEQTVQWEFAQIKDKDYYSIFGMTPAKFSFNTLKETYFAKMREYSPERFMELSGATSVMAQDILSIYADAYNTLSNVVAKERYDEMLNDNKTIGLDGRQDGRLHAKVQFQSGKVFLGMGEFENAEKALQEAYTLDPENAGHAAFLAWAIYRNSANSGSKAALERARSLLSKSLQIEKSAEAFAFRGWMLYDEGRDGLAEGEFMKALKINAREPNALKGLRLITEKKEAEKKGVLRRFFG